MEFSSADEIPTFTAMAGTITGVPTLLAPLLGGILVDVGGFRLLFGVALAFAVAGFVVMRLLVKEPRSDPQGGMLAASVAGGEKG